jgi:DNA-binding transcriptional ArsR family regulator
MHPLETNDPRLAKALGHPLRVRIIGVLEGGPASPSAVAAQLDEKLPNVSYHVKHLASLGVVKLTKTTARGGAIEHTYELAITPSVVDPSWGEMPAIARNALLSSHLAQLGAHISAAAERGGFDRENAHLTREKLRLDERGLRELAKVLADVSRRAKRIESDSKDRLKKVRSKGAIDTTVVSMLFETPPE